MKLDKVFQDVLKRDPDEPAIEENHVWYPRRRLTAVAEGIGKILAANGIAPGAPVGLVARNRLPHLGALFGLLWKWRGGSAEFPFGPALCASLFALVLWG